MNILQKLFFVLSLSLSAVPVQAMNKDYSREYSPEEVTKMGELILNSDRLMHEVREYAGPLAKVPNMYFEQMEEGYNDGELTWSITSLSDLKQYENLYCNALQNIAPDIVIGENGIDEDEFAQLVEAFNDQRGDVERACYKLSTALRKRIEKEYKVFFLHKPFSRIMNEETSFVGGRLCFSGPGSNIIRQYYLLMHVGDLLTSAVAEGLQWDGIKNQSFFDNFSDAELKILQSSVSRFLWTANDFKVIGYYRVIPAAWVMLRNSIHTMKDPSGRAEALDEAWHLINLCFMQYASPEEIVGRDELVQLLSHLVLFCRYEPAYDLVLVAVNNYKDAKCLKNALGSNLYESFTKPLFSMLKKLATIKYRPEDTFAALQHFYSAHNSYSHCMVSYSGGPFVSTCPMCAELKELTKILQGAN